MLRRGNNTWTAWSVLGLVVIGAAAAAGLQPEGDRAKMRERMQERGGERMGDRNAGPRLPKDREEAKTLIKKQLAELDRRRERLAKIAERLEKGEDPAAIEKDMPEQPTGAARGMGPNTDSRREVLRIVRESRPELATRLEEMAKTHPVGDAIIWRMGPNPGDLAKAKNEDPALFDLRLDELDLGMAVVTSGRALAELKLNGTAETPEGEEAKQTFRRAVAASYDIRQKIQERDIDALAKRVERLRGEFAQRMEKRDEAIAKLGDELVARFQRLEEARRKNEQKQPK